MQFVNEYLNRFRSSGAELPGLQAMASTRPQQPQPASPLAKPGYKPSKGFTDFAHSSSRWVSSSISAILTKTKLTQPEKMTLQQVKLKCELCLQDLHSTQADRVRQRLRHAREVRDLWYLRSEIHNLVSQQSGQEAAAESINSLLPYFAGWIPSEQLLKI